MFKVLTLNEADCLEVFVCTGAYIDPDNPCSIVISTYKDEVDIRIQHTSVDEADDFISLLFECDKLNLYEISKDNPTIQILIEPTEDLEDCDYDDIMSILPDEDLEGGIYRE